MNFMLHVFIRCSINGASLKVFEDGKIWRYGKIRPNAKEEKWIQCKGTIHTTKRTGYKRHLTFINKKQHATSRIVYKAFHPEWDIDDNGFNNTIDHINRNSLDNRLCNLRIANMTEQALNRDFVINQQGYTYDISKNKYMAHIRLNKKQKHLGNFNTADEAKHCFEQARLGIIPKLREIKGCIYDKRRNKWYAYIKINGKTKNLGTFKTEAEAHTAYLNAKHLGNV